MITELGFQLNSPNDLKELDCAGSRERIGMGRCSRCGGLMVTEQYVDILARRCVQCGELIDSVILQNRHRSLPVRAS